MFEGKPCQGCNVIIERRHVADECCLEDTRQGRVLSRRYFCSRECLLNWMFPEKRKLVN
jgi:hypothetical protein